MDLDTILHIHESWSSKLKYNAPQKLQALNEYFEDLRNKKQLRKLFDSEVIAFSNNNFSQVKRNLEIRVNDKSNNNLGKREKRENDKLPCNSEITTLTIGCSTADRMEFQSECIDDTASITGYYKFFQFP